MRNSYSNDHIAENHIHTDIIYIIEESELKYRLRTVSDNLLGALPRFSGSKTSLLASAVVPNT